MDDGGNNNQAPAGPPSGGGSPGGSPKIPEEPTQPGASSFHPDYNREEGYDKTNCDFMYTHRFQAVATCGSGGSGPYTEHDINVFSAKMMEAILSTNPNGNGKPYTIEQIMERGDFNQRDHHIIQTLFQNRVQRASSRGLYNEQIVVGSLKGEGSQLTVVGHTLLNHVRRSPRS
ncbi:hypothetical protein SLEP1_g59129 [Rubroshorea leprosula]|uniref:Uncharacterized protein n=1 Tax=Rubroshorea leprosula TaxID=152421 RepID=A0AAV5MVJ2_9ROSI|nr:hypothetical protein SLEP1_g59129 [Rubroshorea leprosula]